MCGRFTASMGEAMSPEAVAALLGLDEPVGAREPRWNVAPGTEIGAALNLRPRRLEDVWWGLAPVWAQRRLVNARVESLAGAGRGGLRGALAARRCVVVADGFYEWRRQDGVSVPWLMTMPDGAPFMMAGLWDVARGPDGGEQRTCAIITRPALGVVAELHERMPVILPPGEAGAEAREVWLTPGRLEPEVALAVLEDVRGAQALLARRVGMKVNDARNEGAELVGPPEAGAEPAPAPASKGKRKKKPSKQLGLFGKGKGNGKE
ncbi:MAG: SOS response-associated peptidase [Deltaproteobacteria bacterium]|nr:SOS response-associated peptidase [Deltaproteobacteria bacterium]